MTNLLIVGIGGVGGYFGGLLSKAFEKNPKVQINFLSRGANLDAIKHHGIKVKSMEQSFIAHPRYVTNNPEILGLVDYIILCTKSYDLEDTLRSLTPCVGSQTTFLPLLNGVDSQSKIQRNFPKNLVADGCANVVSRLTGPGEIERFSDFQKMHFGIQGREDERLNTLLRLFIEAGIDVTLSVNIEKAIWSKFIFISSAAAATTYFDATFDQVSGEADYRDQLEQLVHEIILLAKAKKIDLDVNIKESTLHMFRQAPKGSTTSMHTDFRKKNGRTELDSLIGYVVREAKDYNIDTPVYKKVYDDLAKRV